MNIVWIEDFGRVSEPAALLAQLFGPLTDGTTLTDYAPDEVRLTQPLLDKYFAAHAPDHKLHLLSNVDDYLKLKEVRNDEVAEHWDVFVIDINLDRDHRADAPIPVPRGFEGVDRFHRKAGLYIYNHLIRAGFPNARACLMTGEDTTLKDFAELCAQSLVEPPCSFHKSDASSGNGLGAFRRWVDALARDDYLALRRGVIDGCAQTLGLLDSRRRVGQSAPPQLLKNTLWTWRVLLPASVCDAQAAQALTSAFFRALVRDWDRRITDQTRAVLLAPPDTGRRPPPGARNAANDRLKAFGHAARDLLCVLRNWVAHTNTLDAPPLRLVALAFLLNLRTRVPSDEPLYAYELSLLRRLVAPPRVPLDAAVDDDALAQWLARGRADLDEWLRRLGGEANVKAALDNTHGHGRGVAGRRLDDDLDRLNLLHGAASERRAKLREPAGPRLPADAAAKLQLVIRRNLERYLYLGWLSRLCRLAGGPRFVPPQRTGGPDLLAALLAVARGRFIAPVPADSDAAHADAPLVAATGGVVDQRAQTDVA